MTRRLLLIPIALATLLVACGDDDDPAASDTTTTTAADDGGGDDGGDEAGGDAVSIAGFAFQPDTLEVSAGSTVTWTNEDSVGHTVTAGSPDDPGEEFAESVDGGGEAAVTFDEAGTFPYFCSIHPNMTGEIVVS